ncbi:tetratricopeptide repeat protein [Baaleninema simplex]|uniref:tetratricopeptide repeat protein n=1 Tax=Baaleninema simplex TaxID=2862350 RepID=UPI00034D94EB|nr:tetratricopeptide repeat protein [Baaleninema simplex]
MSDRDRYLAVIDKLVETTLAGKIRSQEQIYQRLLREIRPGTGEIFERCLAERLGEIEASVGTTTKVSRMLRALQTIEKQWERWEKDNQETAAIASAVRSILASEPEDRLEALLGAIDPNQNTPWTAEQLRQLATSLKAEAEDDSQVWQLAAGLIEGLTTFARLEGSLVSWMYETRRNIGFGGTEERPGPWSLWARNTEAYFPSELFQTLARGESVGELAARHSDLSWQQLVELAIALQGLQRGLVTWFDRQPYDVKMGKQLSVSTFLVFSSVWCQLSEGFSSRPVLADACFQIALQILRTFAGRETFPLYGGVFASFSGEYLEHTLEYLELPLKRIEGTQEKARILTLLGYSQRAAGQLDRAREFHEEALEIAGKAGDIACEIANYNHLSRLNAATKDYRAGLDRAQRALIVARQAGDRRGEANALANWGYSRVLQAQQLERLDEETSEQAIAYLQQGLTLSEKLGDRQSLALCAYSLGLAYVLLQQPSSAVGYLQQGLDAARASGDLYLQGLNFSTLAEAYYNLQDVGRAIVTAAVAAFLLDRIQASQWRQAAGLLVILQGQLGEEAFQTHLERERSQIIPFIGVDGYDDISNLIDRHRGEG